MFANVYDYYTLSLIVVYCAFPPGATADYEDSPVEMGAAR